MEWMKSEAVRPVSKTLALAGCAEFGIWKCHSGGSLFPLAIPAIAECPGWWVGRAAMVQGSSWRPST